MLLWLSDTLGTAAHIVKLLTVSLRSTGFRNVGWVGLGQQICTHVHLWYTCDSVYFYATEHLRPTDVQWIVLNQRGVTLHLEVVTIHRGKNIELKFMRYQNGFPGASSHRPRLL